MQVLTGGREDLIYRQQNNVIRPLNNWSTTVHQLLEHLHNKGFTQAPRFIKTDGQCEILSFIEGETYNYPLIGAIASEQALTSSAKLLRKLHDASADFLTLNNNPEQQWMLPSRAPHEVICHGDFTPYNVALKDNEVIGVFDFDTAHPAPRIWDVAFSVYAWAPFKTDNIDKLGSLTEQIERAELFCDNYEASFDMRERLVQVMITRLQALVDYMCQQAAEGDKQFVDNIEDAHHLSYLKDIHYLQQHQTVITAGLVAS